MVRIKELDGIRGIAILLVLLWHYIACQATPAKGSALGYFTRSLALTWSGVDLFFVLSGFLIVGTEVSQFFPSSTLDNTNIFRKISII